MASEHLRFSIENVIMPKILVELSLLEATHKGPDWDSTRSMPVKISGFIHTSCVRNEDWSETLLLPKGVYKRSLVLLSK